MAQQQQRPAAKETGASATAKARRALRRSGSKTGQAPGGSRNSFGRMDLRENAVSSAYAAPCTQEDIARLAGVSTATVSRVKNRVGNVSRETKSRILAAILKLGYSPNAHAVELAHANGGIPRKRRKLHAALLQTRRTIQFGFESEAGKDLSDAERIRALEEENSRLRKLVASLRLQDKGNGRGAFDAQQRSRI